jgi:hypothetical protein
VVRRRGLRTHPGARAAGPKLDAGDMAEIGELLATATPTLTMHKPAAIG